MADISFRLIILFASFFLVSCGQQRETKVVSHYRVEIKRTSYGIPHIIADDFGSLGFGEGFASAEDHVCNIADAIVVARGERSKYHGVGENNKYLIADIAIRALEIAPRAKVEFLTQAEENKAWFTGYAAGYNKYIRDIGRDNITSWCKGAEWVKEITPEDLFARFQMFAPTAQNLAGMIIPATPPKGEQGKEEKISSITFSPELFTEAVEALRPRYRGSNGWAIGRDRTENGRGMLMGNPHYFWTGFNRFWEKHLIIPGRMNLYGASLVGMPGVVLGFNENVGWTPTVSASHRITFYKLDLVPGDATSYFYDGVQRKMTSKTVKVPVKGEGGGASIKEHVVWFSHYGPIISVPGAPWTDKMAITIRDANSPNDSLFSQWKDMGMAKDMDSLKEAHRKWNAMPWINTIATGKEGRAVYIDGSNVGRLSEEAISLWRDRVKNDPLTKLFHQQMRSILLDGSDSRFEWQPHPEARIPGVVPYVEQPKQDRADYIFNANDSYWLTNSSEPLVGYSPMYGEEATPRSPRTRMNDILLSDISPDGPAGTDGKFSLTELQNTLLGNRSMTAELLLDDLVTACIAINEVKIGDEVVNLSKACEALAGYNKHLDLDSNGAILFREWITHYSFPDLMNAGTLFTVPFDPDAPVNTPRNLADKEKAIQNLGLAVQVMKREGLALDSSLGDTQFAYRGGQKVALHGGNYTEGVANIVGQWMYDTMAKQIRGTKVEGSSGLTEKGYPILGGASYLLGLSFTDDGPVAEAVMTYGQSGDATSEHYADQLKLFNKKQWRPVLYKMEDINQDIISSLMLTEGIVKGN